MRAGNERGAILVATLLLLVLLTLLGAGALMSVTVQSKAGGNLARGLGAFYASESGLEVGAGKLSDHFTTELSPFEPDAIWTTPSTADDDPFDGATFGPDADHTYTVQYRISNAIDPSNPATVPAAYPFTTAEGGQQLIHYSYQYKIEAKATSNQSTESEATSEIIRVLETPLIQYYLFFDDDMSWHNGPQMDSWGRVHTNGNFYYAAESNTFFRDFDKAGNLSPNNITVGGDIIYGSFLQQGNATAPASVVSSRATDPMYVRVRNRGTVASPVANPPTSDCEQLASIDSTNRGSEEERFRSGNDYIIRTGVDKVSGVSSNSLWRIGAGTGSGFYERISKGPQRDGVDGIFISVDPGAVQVLVSRRGHATEDVTNLLAAFQVSGGVPVDIADWPTEVRRRAPDPVGISSVTSPSVADRAASTVGTGDPITDLVPGSAVYSVESPITAPLYTFHTNGTTTVNHIHKFDSATALKTAAYDPTAAANTQFDHNPWYPVVLEVEDGRENKAVDFTVIDMQLLQYWYYDYLDYLDGSFNENVDTSAHSLIIYVTRSGQGSNTPVSGTGTSALQAIKLIGGQQGRIHSNGVTINGGAQFTGGSSATRQGASTFLFRTTLATPEPVYLVGDFNAPQAAAGNESPTTGTAILSDAAIFISNGWNHSANTWDRTSANHAGAGSYRASNTAFNSAFFTGRYNFRSGGGGEEGGIHNFTRFNEQWTNAAGTQQTCSITGCLINLWWSARATAPHGGSYYGPPRRAYGWDTGFASFNYWPPYVPSSYSIERSVWQEN